MDELGLNAASTSADTAHACEDNHPSFDFTMSSNAPQIILPQSLVDYEIDRDDAVSLPRAEYSAVQTQSQAGRSRGPTNRQSWHSRPGSEVAPHIDPSAFRDQINQLNADLHVVNARLHGSQFNEENVQFLVDVRDQLLRRRSMLLSNLYEELFLLRE